MGWRGFDGALLKNRRCVARHVQCTGQLNRFKMERWNLVLCILSRESVSGDQFSGQHERHYVAFRMLGPKTTFLLSHVQKMKN